MNSRRLNQILAAASGLGVVIWIALGLWASHDAKNKNWMVDQEADPAVAPLPNVTADDWVAILADPHFASKSREERMSAANQRFDKIKGLADEQGYDLKALQRWYQQTATDAERYPLEKFVFAPGVETYYRDLRQSGFPKPSTWRVFRANVLNGYAVLIVLIGLPIVGGLLWFLAGIVIAVFSRRLSVKWRVLIIGLVAIILGEAWLIKNTQRHPVSLGLFTFYDGGDYISVEGTWTSNVKLAGPLQVTRLDCWHQWNHCIEATGRILGGQLSVNTNYWEVTNWGANELTFKDNGSSICRIEKLHVDRKSEIVTYTSASKRPKPDSCKSFEDEPIISHLVDGYKLRYQ